VHSIKHGKVLLLLCCCCCAAAAVLLLWQHAHRIQLPAHTLLQDEAFQRCRLCNSKATQGTGM
jgi:hypothetical protein